MEEFSCKTRILAGKGALQGLSRWQGKRVFLVHDPGAGGMLPALKSLLGEKVCLFPGPQDLPTVAQAAQGAAGLRDFQGEVLVAFGDSGTVDCGKVMARFAGNGCPVVAIPTTSGSGSEVTDFATMIHNGQRHILSNPRLRPEVAIVDSELLTGLSGEAVGDGGFLSLSRSVESFAAKGGGMVSGLLARESFSSAFAALPASYAGRRDVRLRVHWAGILAGLAATHAGLGLCSALCHALAERFGVPMGALSAIVLPAVVGCNAHAAGHKYGELARAAGLGGSSDAIGTENLRKGLIRLRRELHLPEDLHQAGVEPRAVWRSSEELVQRTLSCPWCAANPVTVEPFLIRRILDGITGRE